MLLQENYFYRAKKEAKSSSNIILQSSDDCLARSMLAKAVVEVLADSQFTHK